MRILNVIIFTLLLSGCLSVITYRESYTIDRMAYWEHKNSKVKASSELKNKCFEKVSYIPDYQELYAKCIYNHGYVFKTTSWLYCYHRDKECDVYNKYRR